MPTSIKKGRPFVIEHKSAIVRSTTATYKPRYEARVFSYKAVKSGKSVIIYETFRKGKQPIKCATYKDSNVPDAVKTFKERPLKYKESTRYGETNPIKILSKTYYTYKPGKTDVSTSSDSIQQQAVVMVRNRQTKREGYYVGYSHKFSVYKRVPANISRGGKYKMPSEKDYNDMDEQCMQHAILLRANIEHPKDNAISNEYELSDADKLTRYEAVIVERRYIVWNSIIRRTRNNRAVDYGKSRDSTQWKRYK